MNVIEIHVAEIKDVLIQMVHISVRIYCNVQEVIRLMMMVPDVKVCYLIYITLL